MKNIKTVPTKIAVTPFPDMSVKTSAQGNGSVRVARIENKVSLVALEALASDVDGKYLPGQKLYVRGDLYTLPWAKEIYEFDGVKFILLPVQYVEMVGT